MGCKPRAILTGIALTCGASLAACGGDSESGGTTRTEDSAATTQTAELVDIKEVESQLKTVLSRPGVPASPSPVPGQAAVPATPALKVKSVNCPTHIEPKKGDEFNCSVQASGAKGAVDLTQQDDQGKVFKFNSKLVRPEVTITTKGKLDLRT